MIKDFLQEKSKLRHVQLDQGKKVMDHHPELSLGPSLSFSSDQSVHSSASEFNSNTNPCRKRKNAWNMPFTAQSGIELHLNIDPLPLDWEQCLDLQSGKMYYINRKTLKKSWTRPKEQKLDLELNISTLPSSEGTPAATSTSLNDKHMNKYNSATGNMVAVACLNCHLLVMLCRSSPSCPNCRYVHPMLAPTAEKPKMEVAKPLETLSLLH